MNPATATAPRGILYIEDFDDAAPPPEPDNTPDLTVLEPSFTGAEIDAARAEAHAAGLAEGRAQQAASQDAARLQLLERLNAEIRSTQGGLQSQAEAVADALAQTLIGCMYGSLPALCRAHAASEIKATLEMVLPGLLRQATCVIFVHPDMAEPVKTLIADLADDVPEYFTIRADAKLLPSDLRAEWQNGRLLRSSATIWNELRQKLIAFQLLDAATPETPHARRS